MNNKTYINGRDKKLLRKLINKEIKNAKLLLDIDHELYGWYWSSQRHGLIKRIGVLDELLTKLQ